MTAYLQYLPVDVGVLVVDVEGIQGIPHADGGSVDGDVLVDVRESDVGNLALLLLCHCCHGGEDKEDADDSLIHVDVCLF